MLSSRWLREGIVISNWFFPKSMILTSSVNRHEKLADSNHPCLSASGSRSANDPGRNRETG